MKHKKYHIVVTQKSNRKIVERGNIYILTQK